ncbi:hypothetical protein ACQ86N_01185 [Puia sp. P3]|uniref:hypothetical protein n=1 Tax=Puia sp. P3 TaxID=3423952 RepID=UPI003D6730E5
MPRPGDVEWGNYLYLLKDAGDYDPNFVTTAVFDSILAMTIPPDARHPIEIADVPHYANKSEYLLEPVSEKDGLSAVVVGSQGIYRYYLNEFQKRSQISICRLLQAACHQRGRDEGAGLFGGPAPVIRAGPIGQQLADQQFRSTRC